MIREYTLRPHLSLASEADRLNLPLPELMRALGVQDPQRPLRQLLTVQEPSPGRFEVVGLGRSKRPHPPLGCPIGLFRAAPNGLELAPGVSMLPVISGARDRTGFDVLKLEPGAQVQLPGRSTDRRFVVLEGEGRVAGEALESSVTAGDVVRVRRGDPLHVGASASPVSILMISSPSTGRLRDSHVCSLDERKSFYKAVEGCEINQVANDPRDPALSVVRARVEAGRGTAPHRVDVNERYFIARGAGFVEVGGVRREVGPGDLVSIPKGVSQRITNTGDDLMEFYAICASAFRKSDYHEVDSGSSTSGPA